MLNIDAKELIRQGDKLFADKKSLDSLFQEIAENFYPQRADFTLTRYLGADFASNLTTSYPILVRRDLGNAISTYLRPRSQQWFKIVVDDMEGLDNESKKWLERATKRQRKFIYDKKSGFNQATKQADHDFATFGNAVLTIEENYESADLLHRCWHLRDVAWAENSYSIIDTVHRNWNPTALELKQTFGDKVHTKVGEFLTGQNKDPYKTVKCRHIMIPVDKYHNPPSGKKFNTAFVSIYIDIDNQHIMEEVGSEEFKYVIPRWELVSGSQYAWSPAVVAALPDGRLMQSITLTLLEAGEKAVNPPMIATQDAVIGTPSLLAGGINYIDYAYDEKTGEALRPMTLNTNGIGFGLDLRNDIKEALSEAFYLNKLNLPVAGPAMTATEVTQRIQEYIRNAYPLFDPMISEYNDPVCAMQFSILLRVGGFGPIEEIPDGLRGKEIKFSFENPLVEAEGKEKAQQFLEAKAAIVEAAGLDPSAANMLDVKVALRDTLNGRGISPRWLRDEKVMDQMDAEQKAREQAQAMIDQLGQGAAVAEQVGKAGIAINQAGIMQ